MKNRDTNFPNHDDTLNDNDTNHDNYDTPSSSGDNLNQDVSNR